MAQLIGTGYIGLVRMNLARKPRDERKRVTNLRLGKYRDSSTNIGPIPYNNII
jgi:hypothetical protein